MIKKFLNLTEAAHLKGCTLAFGHFNTIHPGHIRYLNHARSQGDSLVVALMGDGAPDQPSPFQFSQLERAEALSLLGIADSILLLNSDELKDVIDSLNPSLLVLGTEFQDSKNPTMIKAINLQRQKGNLVQFHAGDIHYASTSLLSNSERELARQRNEQFISACRRQGLKSDQLLMSMKSWNDTRLLVIGDTIVDQYAACEPIGMSAEAPVVVVKELERKNFIGGAAIVASHIKALGASCDLLSIVGDDEEADLVKQSLLDRGIGDNLLIDSSRPTTFKKRYVVENQKLFRVSRLEDHILDRDIEDKLIKKIELLSPHVQGVVVSDFVYGVVTQKLLDALQRLSSKYGLLLFGDLQCSSQIGSVERFKNFSLLCPNEREARLALKDKDIGLELLSQRLVERTNTNRLVMKLGSDGFIAYDRDDSGERNSQPFPALSVNPVDVAGAGDSLLAVMATGLASGQKMMVTAALGCCMSALAVETMGNTPISRDALRNKLLETLG